MNPINHKDRIKRFLEDLKLIKTESQKDDKYKIIKKGSWVIDERSDQYFHWLTDCMQRIQLIDEELYEYPILKFLIVSLTLSYFNKGLVKAVSVKVGDTAFTRIGYFKPKFLFQLLN